MVDSWLLCLVVAGDGDGGGGADAGDASCCWREWGGGAVSRAMCQQSVRATVTEIPMHVVQ